MVYYNNNYRGYRNNYGGYKKKRYYKKKPTRYENYSAGIGQLSRDVGKLKNLINVEFKALDTTVTVSPSTTFSRYVLNAASQGDDYNARDGRQVRWKSIQINGTLEHKGTDAIVRGLLVIDTQPNQGLAALTDILNVENTYSLRNLDERKRFVILVDRKWSITSDNAFRAVKIFKKLDMKTVYDGTSGTFADITSNSLIWCVGSTTATQQPLMNFQARARFIDN